jgi:UDP-GlcNAc:undecaprenyl-phosphate GlcNAc-1-phosphate transferase
VLEARLLLGLGFATALVFWGTPVAIRVAARLNFYDRPAGYKGHGAPTPYLGGAPVVIAFVLVLAILTRDWERTLPVAGGVLALWGLGTLDDRRTVSPGVRVGAEIALASVLFGAGQGWEIGPPVVGLILTIIWVVAVVNALNLFDNMDGAASSIAVVISGGVAVIGAVQGDVWLSVAAAGLSGACLGFLPHNLSKPARIFLGDGGSMPVGFALSALVMMAAGGSGADWQALAIGILLVGVPALDTCLVIISRRRRGISILTGGRDHLTHRTFQRLRTTRAVAFALGAVQAILAALALVASRESTMMLVVVVLLYVAGSAVAITVLDRGSGREQTAPAAAEPQAAGWRRPENGLLVLLGLGAGVSPFLEGMYAETVWAPVGLGLLVLLAAVVIARPVPVSRAAGLALGSLAGLGALALLSSSWAASSTNAVTNGNRYVVYAVFLALVLMLVRDARSGAVLVGSFALGAVCVATVDLVRMFGGDLGQLFIGGRLNGPLGYINGQGDFFLLAVFPCLALAEQRRYRWLGGLAVACSTLMLGLAFMAQSRGVILAAAVGLIVVVALVQGRRRRIAAITLICAGVAAAAPAMIDLFHSVDASGGVAPSAAHDAARALLAGSIVAGGLWWMALEAERHLRERRPRAFEGLRIAFPAVCIVVAIGAVGVGLVNAGRLGDEIDRQYTAFVHLDPTQGGDSSTGRLASGGGNRYDYWRVAADTWSAKPVAGVGGGNYAERYYRSRRTAEAIQQPHSIELQTLSELGLLGGALLVAMLGAVAIAVAGARRRAGTSLAQRGLLVACAGTIAAWSVHSSVDWIHLLPGVTAVVLIAVGVLFASEGRAPRPRVARVSFPRGVLVAAGAVLITLTATSLTRQTLSDWFRSRAQTDLAQSPADALKWANRALRLDSGATSTYYVKAAAIARFGQGPAAESVLKTAIAREPDNFLTYALLGDLYTREGETSLARAAYRAALERNPRDPGLLALVRNPKVAATSVR